MKKNTKIPLILACVITIAVLLLFYINSGFFIKQVIKMYFTIYLDDETEKQLQQEMQNSDLSRNAIIKLAIVSWLSNREKQWPDEVLNYQGDKQFPAFENYREDLTD